MSNKEKSLVSIIIPLFNRKSLIGHTLASILNQSYSNWEAVVVDDGSMDGSFEFVQELVKKDARIKLFRRPEGAKGAPVCRNVGIEQAQGDYLIFLDSDDLLAYYCLEKRVALMDKNPAMHFAVYPIITFEKQPGDLNILWNILKDTDDLDRFLSADSPWQTSSPIWRKEFLSKLRWDEESISGQDWEFHVRALSLGPEYIKIDTIPDCFIRRDAGERISKNNSEGLHILNRQIRWQKIYNILKENNLWKKTYNKPYATSYFVYCEIAIMQNYPFNVWDFYYPVWRDKLLSKRVFISTAFYLMTLKGLKNHRFLRNYFRKYFRGLVPASFKRQLMYLTQQKVKLEGPKLEEFLMLNNLIN